MNDDVPREPFNQEPAEIAADATELSTDGSARNWAMLCHLASLVGFVGPVFGHILGPLVVWLIKKDEHPFIDEHGKESLNFQISMMIYSVAAIPTLCIFIGFFLLPLLVVLDAVFAIIAAIKASSGEHYRYPLTIRFVK